MIDNNIAAVQFEIKLFNFHYQFTQLTYYTVSYTHLTLPTNREV